MPNQHRSRRSGGKANRGCRLSFADPPAPSSSFWPAAASKRGSDAGLSAGPTARFERPRPTLEERTVETPKRRPAPW
eukprot:4346624-Lingulodinium_polyedra.AAC.1